MGLTHSQRDVPLFNNSSYREHALPMENYAGRVDELPGCDVLYHFAWGGARGPLRDDEEAQRANFNYSRALILGLGRKLDGASVILAGSQAEYGPRTGGPIGEDMRCQPSIAYGRWKLALFEDLMAMRSSQGFDVIDARFFSLYGPSDRCDTMLFQLVDSLRQDLPFDLGPCTQLWNYCHIDDAARALVALGEQRGYSGAVNVASHDTRLLRSFVYEARLVLRSTSILHFNEPVRESGFLDLNPSIERLTELTGFRPRVGFFEGVRELAKAL